MVEKGGETRRAKIAAHSGIVSINGPCSKARRTVKKEKERERRKYEVGVVFDGVTSLNNHDSRMIRAETIFSVLAEYRRKYFPGALLTTFAASCECTCTNIFFHDDAHSARPKLGGKRSSRLTSFVSQLPKEASREKLRAGGKRRGRSTFSRAARPNVNIGGGRGGPTRS